MDHRVSVIIPCYNAEKTIDRAIQSVFNQQYQNLELIVVDDGSLDSSKEKIAAWENKFEYQQMQLKYVWQENKGPGGAINTGLKYVAGEFLMLLDADDEYLPGAISERIAYFDSHPTCAVVRSNGWQIKGNKRTLFVQTESEKDCQDIFTALVKGETNNWAGSYMVRTSALFEFYPDREIYASRYGQNLQILMPVVYKYPCGFIDKPLMNYILQSDSLSQTSEDPGIAKPRDLKNAAGFKDIRVHMLHKIVKEKIQLKTYLDYVESGYWHSVMWIALRYSDKILLKEAVKNIRTYQQLTLDEKIGYYHVVCPPVAFCLRVAHRLHRIFN